MNTEHDGKFNNLILYLDIDMLQTISYYEFMKHTFNDEHYIWSLPSLRECNWLSYISRFRSFGLTRNRTGQREARLDIETTGDYKKWD